MQLYGDLTHPTNSRSGRVDGGGNRQPGGTWDRPFWQHIGSQCLIESLKVKSPSASWKNLEHSVALMQHSSYTFIVLLPSGIKSLEEISQHTMLNQTNRAVTSLTKLYLGLMAKAVYSSK